MPNMVQVYNWGGSSNSLTNIDMLTDTIMVDPNASYEQVIMSKIVQWYD